MDARAQTCWRSQSWIVAGRIGASSPRRVRQAILADRRGTSSHRDRDDAPGVVDPRLDPAVRFGSDSFVRHLVQHLRGRNYEWRGSG